MYKYFLINLFLVNVCFNLGHLTPNYLFNQRNNSSTSDIILQTDDFNYIIGIMVDFPIEREEFQDLNSNGYWNDNEPFEDMNGNGVIDYHDYNNDGLYNKELKSDGSLYYEDYDNPKTSGLGKFVLNDLLLNYNSETFTSRCDGIIIDNFPHDANYFSNQILAVKNYYNSISNGLIDFDFQVIDSVYTVSEHMENYSYSDQTLGGLFSESLNLAKGDIESYLALNNIDVNDVLFVVFHAGLGQDFSVPFLDPTTSDLKSAYVDDEMLDVFNLSEINGVGINRGLLLPETQNFIFYDVVEDIFPELKSDIGYCGIQVGLSGTFSFLLGYGFGFSPMFLSDGTTGVGKFGLMDYGSNNGRGVIPAPPTPWTRIEIAEKYSSVDDILIPIVESGTYTLQPRHIDDTIYKVKISDSEYYLIENRNNNIIADFDLDILQFIYGGDCGSGIDVNNMNDEDITSINNCLENSTSTDRYDYFEMLSMINYFSFDNANSVITNVSNYDYGLPGSGLLIWHVDEEQISDNLIDDINCGSVNCSLAKRGIQLEEADGSVDIGYNSSHPLFTEHINGWEYDFWYLGNEYYFNYGNSNFSNNDTLFFDSNSNPNTYTNSGSLSMISIDIIDDNNGAISFNVSFDGLYENVFLSDTSIQIIGSGSIDGDGNIFYIEDDLVYQHSNLAKIQINEEATNKKVLVYNDNYHFVDLVDDHLVYWNNEIGQIVNDSDPFIAGYYESLNNILYLRNSDFSISESSLGDIDSDGLDELVYVNLDGGLTVQNSNQTYSNGYPVSGSFFGTPLIANIIDIEDEQPEIICREGNSIVVLSSDGQRLLNLASFDINSDIRIIPDWKDGKAAIADGNRLILVDYDNEYSYWLSKYSNSYDYPMVLNHHSELLDSNKQIQPSYNYPNPITKGYTTFRFYVKDESQVKINIYDINGFKIESLVNPNVVNNEYNEIKWEDISGLSAGLYYAEVVFENRKSELIKLAIIQ